MDIEKKHECLNVEYDIKIWKNFFYGCSTRVSTSKGEDMCFPELQIFNSAFISFFFLKNSTILKYDRIGRWKTRK